MTNFSDHPYKPNPAGRIPQSNPYTHPGPSNPLSVTEWYAVQWYSNLNFQQQQYLANLQGAPVSASIPLMIDCFKDRDNIRKLPDWPTDTLRTI